MFRPELHHSLDMRIDPAAPDLVTSRLREICLSETRKKRSDNHHGTAQLGTLGNKVRAGDILPVNIVSLENIYALVKPCDGDTHALKQENKILYVKNLRDIGDFHLF